MKYLAFLFSGTKSVGETALKGLIQRVTQASVAVDGQVIGEINAGLLLFLGVEKHDTEETAQQMLDKVTKYRVFGDEDDRMNKSLLDAGGELLVVSQFTLAASTRKGLRPSFSSAGSPELGQKLYDHFVEKAKEKLGENVATGQFGADMKVSLLNDGPVTFLLEI